MLFRARLCHICPSVTFNFKGLCFHTGWNRTASKIISRLISLTLLLGLTPNGRSGPTGTPQNFGWSRGGVTSRKTCNISEMVQDIGPRVLWGTNRKSHTRFRLVQKLTTLNGQNVTVAEKKVLRRPPEKCEWIDPYCQRQNVGRWFQFLEI